VANRHSNTTFVIIVYFTFTFWLWLFYTQTKAHESAIVFGQSRAFTETEKLVVLLSLRDEDNPEQSVWATNGSSTGTRDNKTNYFIVFVQLVREFCIALPAQSNEDLLCLKVPSVSVSYLLLSTLFLSVTFIFFLIL
jgi:hypothetical protein